MLLVQLLEIASQKVGVRFCVLQTNHIRLYPQLWRQGVVAFLHPLLDQGQVCELDSVDAFAGLVLGLGKTDGVTTVLIVLKRHKDLPKLPLLVPPVPGLLRLLQFATFVPDH